VTYISLTSVEAFCGNLQVLLGCPGLESRVTWCVSGGVRVFRQLSPEDLDRTGLTGVVSSCSSCLFRCVLKSLSVVVGS
jgi:hypothetical protein